MLSKTSSILNLSLLPSLPSPSSSSSLPPIPFSSLSLLLSSSYLPFSSLSLLFSSSPFPLLSSSPSLLLSSSFPPLSSPLIFSCESNPYDTAVPVSLLPPLCLCGHSLPSDRTHHWSLVHMHSVSCSISCKPFSISMVGKPDNETLLCAVSQLMK